MVINFLIIFGSILLFLSFINRKELFPSIYEDQLISTALKLARNHSKGVQRVKL